MQKAATYVRKKFDTIASNSLLRNSFFIMASTAVTAAVGFLFWTICSRLYSPQEIGLATALIAATALASNLSMLGFNNALVAFLPKTTTTQLANTAMTVVSVAGIAAGAVLILLAGRFDPNLPQLMPHLWQQLLVVLYVASQSLNALLDSMFIARRNAHYILLKNSLASIGKLVLPWLLAGLAGFGIFGSVVFVTLISLLLGIVGMARLGYRPRIQIAHAAFRQVRRFTLGNYLGNIFGMLPATLTPIVVGWILGVEEVAYFYIALTISLLLNIIPSASAQSFFAEASHHPERATELLRQALRHVYILLIPAVLVLVCGGGLLLQVFGPEYAEHSLLLLQLLAMASLFSVVNYMGDTYLNIQRRVRAFIFMNIWNAAAVIGCCVIGMQAYGLAGLGYGWLAGQLLTNIAYALLVAITDRQRRPTLKPTI